MADPHKPLDRSQVMARIRGQNTKPELLLRKALWAKGARYRTQWKHASGCRVDIAFSGLRIAVQVDGCFWHGCPEHCTRPKSNQDFWERKLNRNMQRDAEQTLALVRDGWLVMRFWEHQIEDHVGLQAAVDKVLMLLGQVGRKG